MIKRFLKDSLLYTLAAVFTRGIGFVMLPLYLAYLSKADYGAFDYLMTVGVFLGVIVSLEIAQSVIRFTSEEQQKSNKQIEIISSGVQFSVFCYLILMITASLNSTQLSLHFFGVSDRTTEVILAFLAYFVMAMMYLSTIIFRAQLNAKVATLSSAISAVLVATITYGLLRLTTQGILALIWGIIIGQGLTAFYNFFKLRHFLSFTIYWAKLKEMLLFSAPLVFSSLGVILATLVDRLMIKEMIGYEALGTYSVAARYAGVVTLLTVGFQSALSPLIYSNLENPDTKPKLKMLFYSYVIGAIFFVLALFLLSKPLFLFMFGGDYIDSAQLLPLIAMAIVIQSGYLFFAGLSIVKKTKVLAGINLFVGLLNIALNMILIPASGVFGAAYATLISSIVFFILNFYFSERYFPIFN